MCVRIRFVRYGVLRTGTGRRGFCGHGERAGRARFRSRCAARVPGPPYADTLTAVQFPRRERSASAGGVLDTRARSDTTRFGLLGRTCVTAFVEAVGSARRRFGAGGRSRRRSFRSTRSHVSRISLCQRSQSQKRL